MLVDSRVNVRTDIAMKSFQILVLTSMNVPNFRIFVIINASTSEAHIDALVSEDFPYQKETITRAKISTSAN